MPPPSKIPSSAVEMPGDSLARLDVQFGGLDLQFGAGGSGGQSSAASGGAGTSDTNNGGGGFEFNGAASSVVVSNNKEGDSVKQQGVPTGGGVSAKDYIGAPPPQVAVASAQQVKDKNKLNSQTDSYSNSQGETTAYLKCR